jgi:hypothetical protein
VKSKTRINSFTGGYTVDIVTMTGRQAIAAQQALQVLGHKPIKIAGAVRVAKALQELATVTGVIEDRRRGLLEMWSVKDEAGKLVTDEAGNATFADGDQELFSQDYNALMAEDIEIEVQPVAVRDLGEIEIEPAALGPLVAVGLIE